MIMNRSKYVFWKRIADFVFAIVLLVIFIPLFLLIILLVAIDQKIEVFFIQNRVGFQKKVFRIFKFKTIQQSGKISKIGKALRKIGLDELPQLLNIINGDMSFVGPRPLVIDYDHLYTDEQSLRYLVLPGLTGLVQVSGGNLLSWRLRFKYDLFYFRNQSFKLDCLILIKTVVILFTRKSTHPSIEFDGNN
jgi:undecaprenyl phosphate N,N'-diacetylbacillosamine 1-phosphate transferase